MPQYRRGEAIGRPEQGTGGGDRHRTLPRFIYVAVRVVMRRLDSGPENPGRVIVRVCRVDVEPGLDARAAAFTVQAFTLPVGFR